PAARLPKRPRAKAAALDKRGEPRGLAGSAPLPARQRAVAHGDAMKRGERRLARSLDSVGNRLLCCEIAGPKHPQPIDEQALLEWRTADEPAVVELGSGKGARETRFSASDPWDAALHEQPGRDDTAPGGDPVEAGDGLVGVA